MLAGRWLSDRALALASSRNCARERAAQLERALFKRTLTASITGAMSHNGVRGEEAQMARSIIRAGPHRPSLDEPPSSLVINRGRALEQFAEDNQEFSVLLTEEIP